MDSVTFNVGEGKYELTITVVPMGKDILVGVYGGDLPHIGSVSVCTAEPYSISTVCLDGHKDNFVGDEISKCLSTRLKKTIAVSCGIHLNNASKNDIDEILKLASRISERIIKLITD